MAVKELRYPEGWDEQRVKLLIQHYESLTEEEQVAEDEAAVSDSAGRIAPMSRGFHKWRHWLVGIAGFVAVVLLWSPFDRLCAAHPSALWVAMGAILILMFVAQYHRELEKRRQNEN